MINPLILSALGVTVCGGILFTRQLHHQRQRTLVQNRVSAWTHERTEKLVSLLKENEAAADSASWLPIAGLNTWLNLLIAQSGSQMTGENLLIICGCLLLAPPAAATVFNFDILLAFMPGLILAALPIMVLFAKKAALRRKFIEQLPDAMDLIISVLRSGHSLPQAVKTVSQEISAPCGTEFAQINQRMNLGLPLPDALGYSCQKFVSHELDLIRRAFAIQSEVGGSLAELLDKTNMTLRQRLKLIKQVKVLTTQSRLTMIIVGSLPIVMAIALNVMNPHYLTPLGESDFGKMLIAGAVVLEILGLFIMKKLSTVKI